VAEYIWADDCVNERLNTMLFLRMRGPYKLNIAVIDAKITRKSPGNYILGRRNLKGKFRAGYVGRSDSDIAVFLKSRVGVTKQSFFKFSYAKSPEAAFKKECKLYHGIYAPATRDHPTPPEGTNWQCPLCNMFDLGSAGVKRKSSGARVEAGHRR
jgi:hypothetical protein